MKEESLNSISELQHASFLNVKVASGRAVKVLAQVDVKFKVNDHNFQDSFLILPSMNSVVLGNPFYKKYNNEISPGANLLKLQKMTYQLNEIRTPKEGRRKNPKSRYPVFMYQKTTVKPQNQEILYTKIEFSKNLEGHTGIIIPLLSPSKIARLLLCFVVFSLGLSGYLVFPSVSDSMFLLGCEVPRLDLLQVICSTTLQAIEEIVSFAIYEFNFPSLGLSFLCIKLYR